MDKDEARKEFLRASNLFQEGHFQSADFLAALPPIGPLPDPTNPNRAYVPEQEPPLSEEKTKAGTSFKRAGGTFFEYLLLGINVLSAIVLLATIVSYEIWLILHPRPLLTLYGSIFLLSWLGLTWTALDRLQGRGLRNGFSVLISWLWGGHWFFYWKEVNRRILVEESPTSLSPRKPKLNWWRTKTVHAGFAFFFGALILGFFFSSMGAILSAVGMRIRTPALGQISVPLVGFIGGFGGPFILILLGKGLFLNLMHQRATLKTSPSIMFFPPFFITYVISLVGSRISMATLGYLFFPFCVFLLSIGGFRLSPSLEELLD